MGETNGVDVMMRTNSCHPRSSDPKCANDYKSLVTLEVQDGANTECIFMTSDRWDDYGEFELTKDGFKLVFTSPLEEAPKDIQEQCASGMTFTSNYICD